MVSALLLGVNKVSLLGACTVMCMKHTGFSTSAYSVQLGECNSCGGGGGGAKHIHLSILSLHIIHYVIYFYIYLSFKVKMLLGTGTLPPI